MTKDRLFQLAKIAGYGALAGAAGGLAEIMWIALYGMLAGSNTIEVARTISSVTSVALSITALSEAPVVAGIAIHMLAAIALGIALIFVWRAATKRRSSAIDEYTFMPIALAVVWMFNFYVVLPLIGPSFAELTRTFVDVVPYPASLFSKLLFGLVVATMLRYGTGNFPAVVRIPV